MGPSPSSVQSRLIGEILVERSLITAEQLERAIELQERTGERLGEIVIAEFGVSRLELAGVLAEQWAELEDAERAAPSVAAPPQPATAPLTPADVQIRKPIGEIFLDFGFASPEQLEAALDVQRTTGVRLGEVLVEQGVISRVDLASALAEQWSGLQKLRPPDPLPDPTPWQNGVPSVERTEVSAPIESPAATEEQLLSGPDPTKTDLAASLGAVSARVEALEALSAGDDLGALRTELESLKGAAGEGADVAALQAAVERLEAQPALADDLARAVSEIAALSARVDGLAAHEPDTSALDELRSRFAQLQAAGATAGEHEAEGSTGAVDLDPIRRELEELRGVVAAVEGLQEIRTAVERLEARPDRSGEIESLARDLAALSARFDDVPSVPDDQGALDALESRTSQRLEDLTAHTPEPAALDELRDRVERLSESVSRHPDRSALIDLRIRVDELAAAVHREPDTAPLDELREQFEDLKRAVDDDAVATALEVRVGEIERRFADTAPASELREGLRLVTEPASTERESLAQELFARVEEIKTNVPHEEELVEIRSQLEALAARPTEDAELRVRVHNVAGRMEALGAVEGVISALQASIEELAALRVSDGLAAGARIAGIEHAIEGLAGLETRVAERVEQDLACQADKLATVFTDLAILRDAADARTAAVDGTLAELARRSAASERELGKRLGDGLDALRADLEFRSAALDPQIERHAGELAALQAEVAGLRESAAKQGALEARVEATVEARLADLTERLTGQIAAARAEVRDASSGIHAEHDSLRASIESATAQLEALAGIREDVAADARKAAEVLSARFDGRVAEEDEAREALRSELERVSSSAGWRLERIEESLAAKDTAALEAAIAGIEERLEGYARLGEEQTRATERALRKGLASLGERLTGTEAEYVEAGTALRRSIERLGAAVVEADARMADQIPISAAEGCVAFAPTGDGYRLVELPGAKPELGSTIEVEGCDGALVVTRFGRSPLPLDNRPCVYLDRA